MALCSVIFNKSVKRQCNSNNNSNTKRVCLSNYRFPTSADSINQSAKSCNKLFDSSDEYDDENSDDEQLCYKLNQIKAKRRASSRISFSSNPNLELSKLISKYSDDEDDVYSDTKFNNEFNYKHIDNNDEKDFESVNNSNRKNSIKEDFKIIQVPKSDKLARSRCFEYLIGAIDEAWARYCDATSIVEDEVFYSDENDNVKNNPNIILNDRNCYMKKVSFKDNEVYDDDDDRYSKKGSDDDKSLIDNYSINSTDITDYSDNFAKSLKRHRNRINSINSNSNEGNQFKVLKDRLTKSKYYLQDLVDSENFEDITRFWNKWDLIKYSTIELVEDDDDDEVIESTIDELENGRYFVN